jgi:hypothetical protein
MRTSPMPFVVSDSSGRGRSPASRPTTAGTVGWSRGSPPVSRTLVTPSDTKTPASRTISSSVSSSALRSHGKPSAGMQYVHRSEHLSVSEIRRSVAIRPNASTSCARCISVTGGIPPQ